MPDDDEFLANLDHFAPFLGYMGCASAMIFTGV
jgi:hypothetical protein